MKKQNKTETPNPDPVPLAPPNDTPTDSAETPAVAPEPRPELSPRLVNRMRTAEAIASEMGKDIPEAIPYTKKVGSWLWIEFPAKPEARIIEAVKRLGFSWNFTRRAWQNPCGHFSRANHRIDPREVYGEEPVHA
jgi:hypothetical protein